MDLRDRTALVTGATGGLGHAIARALAARGAQLVLTGRRADVLAPLATETGGRAMTCDLADRGAVDALIAELGEDVDVLVANAALPASGRLLDLDAIDVDRALDVNLRAPMHLARSLGIHMAARGAGHLVFVSSMSGKIASPGGSVYSATKFGLRGFALGLREDLRGRGVGVSTVFPGFISDAGMFAEAGVELPRYVKTRRPEDVGAAVVRAIERDRPEVDVAPLGVRIGAALAGVMPGPAAAVQRRLGAERVAEGLAEAQRRKR